MAQTNNASLLAIINGHWRQTIDPLMQSPVVLSFSCSVSFSSLRCFTLTWQTPTKSLQRVKQIASEAPKSRRRHTLSAQSGRVFESTKTTAIEHAELYIHIFGMLFSVLKCKPVADCLSVMLRVCDAAILVDRQHRL